MAMFIEHRADPRERLALLLRLRDGKVVWAKVYRGQDEALAAAGLA